VNYRRRIAVRDRLVLNRAVNTIFATNLVLALEPDDPDGGPVVLLDIANTATGGA